MQYHVRSPAAIAGGILAGAGSMALLVRDVWSTGLAGLTVDLAMLPLLSILTIAAGLLAHRAMLSGALISSGLLWCLTVLGFGLIVSENIGRRAEVRDTKVAEVVTSNGQREQIERYIAEAEYILASCPAGVPAIHHGVRCGIRDAMASECASGDGKRCLGRKETIRVYEATIDGYRSRLAGAGAPRPIDPKAERIVSLAALAGITVTAEFARARVAELDAIGVPVFLMLAEFLLLLYGASPPPIWSRIRMARARRQGAAATSVGTGGGVSVCLPEEPSGPAEQGPRGGLRRHTRDEALQDLRTLLKAGHSPESQEWLRERWGLPENAKGTVSRWLRRWQAEGELPGVRYVEGRRKAIRPEYA